MSETPENEERDAYDETRSVEDPLGPFDAFRARRAQEQAENEPFPQQYATEQFISESYESPQFEQFESSPYELPYAQPVPMAQGEASGRGRGRLRSIAVLGGAAVLVAGAVGGVYAATRSSGAPAAATSPGVTASASASPSAGAQQGAKNGKAVTARLTVTSVGSDSFTGTTAAGKTVTVQLTTATKFGTTARPFDRSQLVPGALVAVRLRREADGTVTATVITAVAGKSGQGPGSAAASPSTSTDTGA